MKALTPQQVREQEGQASPQHLIAVLKMRAGGRYGLVRVPGRPEELRQPGTTSGVAISYGCFSIRVRLMEGRQWLASFDLPARSLSAAGVRRFHEVLDAHFGAPVNDSVGRLLLGGLT